MEDVGSMLLLMSIPVFRVWSPLKVWGLPAQSKVFSIWTESLPHSPGLSG